MSQQTPSGSGGGRAATNSGYGRGRGSGMYHDGGGHTGGRAYSTPYQPPTPEQQRFLKARNTLRNALEEVDVETGRSMMVRQPRVEGQPAVGRGRGGVGFNGQQQMQNGIPASHMTPHAASQPQLAQHGASVVRSSVVSVPQGAVHFFSSVQKRGGAFTASERETYDQLRRSGAISKDRGLRSVSSKYAGAVKTGDLERRFARMEAERVSEEFAAVSSKRHRFEVTDSSSSSSSDGNASDVDEDNKSTHSCGDKAPSSAEDDQ